MKVERKRAARSLCGVYDCSGCNLLGAKKCSGCASGALRIIREGGEPCAVYTCVRTLGVVSCAECSRQPCRLGKWPPERCPLRGRFGEAVRYENFCTSLSVAKGVAAGPGKTPGVPSGTMERLHCYLHVMNDYERRGVTTLSSHHLARIVGVKASLVRRDLSGVGHYGNPGGGYRTPMLRRAIMRRLCLERNRPALWLGADRLARDEGARDALAAANCRLAAVFDTDQRLVGTTVAGLAVQPLHGVAEQARAHGTAVAILASQEATDPQVVQALIRAGVKAFLNLTPASVAVGSGVVVEQADLGSQLSRLLSRLALDRQGFRRGGIRSRRQHGKQ